MRLFKEQYPDFDYSDRKIIKELSRLPTEYNISYDRALRNKSDGKRGHFFGLYSIHEQDNVKHIRDLEYEKQIINNSVVGINNEN